MQKHLDNVYFNFCIYVQSISRKYKLSHGHGNFHSSSFAFVICAWYCSLTSCMLFKNKDKIDSKKFGIMLVRKGIVNRIILTIRVELHHLIFFGHNKKFPSKLLIQTYFYSTYFYSIKTIYKCLEHIVQHVGYMVLLWLSCISFSSIALNIMYRLI